MASFKNTISTLVQLSRNASSCLLSRSRTHIFYISLLLLSVFFVSTSLTERSPTALASAMAARLRLAANYFSSFSSVSSSNTCLVSDLRSNCTLSSVTTVERTPGNSVKDGRYVIKDLGSCDIFNGNWVLDDSDPVYLPGSCPYIDDSFNCYKNGRVDFSYVRYRWKPFDCQIPRFDGRKMLKMLRGKRLVFVGDSLNRNMWESLVCALRESSKDKRRIIEVFRTQGLYSFRFKDYKCSIDFFKSPFLVQEWKISDKIGTRRETLRLDMIQGSKYSDADIIVFNTGHWWTHQKTNKGKNYFQEDSHVYNRLEVKEAFAKALRTWAKWVDANIDRNRTRVFFGGYSASHFRKGQWDAGGHCDGETEPIANEASLAPYPWMMNILESVIAGMKTPVFYLNITKMTAYRKDGHPSVYRTAEIPRNPSMFQDCSHWCLPGVPDSWNELLYATLLISGH
ncbi:protein trichome birefringence-like 4 [Herrania umbratica]|uniref:Protein trichome birefringence-like 4 n=1 Tax=Herrania umbratica TaxID=108875 RepID=A0A6J1AW76_9ROSI|nr:protein trichome birefringence-like 4 [Herrania umbratica]